MTPKVYSYARISSKEQEKGQGLERQREYAENYAREHGFELDESLRLEDSGRSAFHGDHRMKGVLGEFMKRVEAGEIARGSVLIVEDLDRLSRENTWDAQGQLSQIIGAGIKVITTRDNQEYSRGDDENPIAPLMATMKMFLAYDESKKKSTRGRKAWEKKRAKIPEGEIPTANCPAWLIPLWETRTDPATGESVKVRRIGYKPRPHVEKTITQIFEWKLVDWGEEKIAQTLNAEISKAEEQEKEPKWWKPPKKHKNQKGPAGWRFSYVRRILRDRRVIGEYQSCRLSTPEENRENGGHRKRIPVGEVIKNRYPCVLVDDEMRLNPDLFDKVQRQFQKNTATQKGEGGGGRKGKINNLFTHIAKCGYCGQPMTIVQKGSGPKGGAHLICSKARLNLGCHKLKVLYESRESNRKTERINSKREPFEDIMLQYCRGLDVRDLLDPKANNERTKKISELEGERARYERELQELKTDISNQLANLKKITDDRTVAIIDENLKKDHDRKEWVEKKIEELTRDINTQNNATDDVQERLDSVQALIKYFASTRRKKDDQKRMDRRRELHANLRRLITRIDVYPEGDPRITAEELVYELLQYCDPEDLGLNSMDAFKKAIRSSEHADPKYHLLLKIYFASGSMLVHRPYWAQSLVLDFNAETGEAKALIMASELEEMLKDPLCASAKKALERQRKRAEAYEREEMPKRKARARERELELNYGPEWRERVKEEEEASSSY